MNNKPDFEKLAEGCYAILNEDGSLHKGKQPVALQHACKFGMEKIWNDYVIPLQSVVPSSGKSLEECRNEIARQFGYESFNIMLDMLGEHTIKHAKHSQIFVCLHSAAELYAKSCTEELRKENEELRRRINELEFPEYPQDQREAVGKILAENITFSPQAGGWVIHGAIDKIIQWASLPSAPIEKT